MDLFYLKVILLVVSSLVVMAVGIVGTVVFHTIRITHLISKGKQPKQTKGQ